MTEVPGGEPTPDDTDFLARRARERADSRARSETERRELEVNLLAPLRELRPEWDSTWADLFAVLAPIWTPWRDRAAPVSEPDVPAIGAALARVGRVVARHDEVTAWYRARRPAPLDIPDTLVGCLGWVALHAPYFMFTPALCAAELVRFAVTASPERVADRVRLLLDDPDDVPAFGWLPFLPNCLWPTDDTFPDPPDPFEDVNWPCWRRVHMGDYQRLQYLLRPTVRPSNLYELFPERLRAVAPIPTFGEPNGPPAAPPESGDPPAANSNWREVIDAQVSQLHCTRPAGLDPALGDVYEGVARAIRECSRLVASVPYLSERPDDYRALAATVATAVATAKAVYMAVDVRLRRAGGENIALGALNDAMTIQSNAPTTPTTVAALNPVLVQLHTNRAGWFQRVDGRGVLDRLVEQLARVPPEVPAAPVRTDWVAELDRLIDLFVRGNEACVASPIVLLAVPAGNVDTRGALRDPSARPLVADVPRPVIEGMTHAAMIGCATILSGTTEETIFLHVVGGGREPDASLERFLELAAESGRLYQRLPSDGTPSPETTSPRNVWSALVFGHMRGTSHLCHHAQGYDFAPHPFVASAELLKRLRDRFVERAPRGVPPTPATQVPAKKQVKGKNIDGQMLIQLAADPCSLNWSASAWADFLGCSDGTVKGTKTWKERIKAARGLLAVDSALARTREVPRGKRKAGKH